MDIAINDGPESLEGGDLVVISGYGAPVVGEIPLLHVRKNTTAGTSALAGVVDKAYTVQLAAEGGADKQDATSPNTTIAAGEHLTVVTLGSYKTVKVDADSGGPIRPGSLLVASPLPGHAMATDAPSCGTVIGKALGAMESGTGVMPIMVTLQ